MTDVIEVYFEILWREPVWVKIGYGFPEAVRGPKQALSYLTFRWPAVRGDNFDDATRRCILALRKEIVCEDARIAFIRAAQDAGMMV